MNDPFHQQPQKCQKDEAQDDGDQDMKFLVFHLGPWAVVEASEEGRGGREEEGVSKEALLSGILEMVHNLSLR